MLRLSELEQYNPITIQCHDNPDGDAIASGFGLYSYFRAKGKEVRLVYSGRNEIHKANLLLMVKALEIPITYIEKTEEACEGLLITVDCQYGAGNVTKLPAEHVAIIDHHQIEIEDCPLSRIEPDYDSCSTLVWRMMSEEGYPVEDRNLGTALYYGLYTDTNQLTELFNPNDMDMRDEIIHDGDLINRLKQTNLSLQELEIAGIALLRIVYNEDYHYAVVKTKPCDPNLLGLISDFMIQVAEINACVVYNEQEDGYKLSVRSCSKEVPANDLVAFLTEGIGSGGGHTDKAGGFVIRRLYEAKNKTLHTQAFFGNRMTEFFDSNRIIYACHYEKEISGMQEYHRKVLTLGYVEPEKIFPVGTSATVRSVKGDLNLVIDGTQYLMIGVLGEVYLRSRENFQNMNGIRPGRFRIQEDISYQPVIKNNADGRVEELIPYAGICESISDIDIYAEELTQTVKVFPSWEAEHYQLGKPGDYLCVRKDNRHEIFIMEKGVFCKAYQKTES